MGSKSSKSGGGVVPKPVRGVDYAALRARLEVLMTSEPEWDDGNLAPVLIRLAWHSSGTYCARTGTGGSCGAGMRFPGGPEAGDPENAGLTRAQKFLEPVAKEFPTVSVSDLWILAAYVGVETTGGPHIPFVPGREDAPEAASRSATGRGRCPFGDGQTNPNGSRLPAADRGAASGLAADAPMSEKEAPTIDAMRATFQRMGMEDAEVVALMCGGHAYGRCHRELSGYAGPWIEEMTVFSNEYAADMVGDRWAEVTADSPEVPDDEVRPLPGKRQYVSLGPPDALARVQGAAAADYPPGMYAVSEGEEWVNARQSTDPKSPVVANPVEGKEYALLTVEQFGNAIRGRVDSGGWVSVVGTGGYPLMQRAGDLALKPGAWVAGESGLAFREPRAALPAGATADVAAYAFEGAAVLGRVDGPEGEAWAVLADAKGAHARRVEEGYLIDGAEVEAMVEEPVKQMMLIADMALLWDPVWRKTLEVYAEDEDRLKADFGKAFKKLTELGFVSGAGGKAAEKRP